MDSSYLQAKLTLIMELHQQGQHHVVAEHCQEILQLHPNHTHTLNLLALATYHLGNAAYALTLLDKILIIDAHFIPAHMNRGFVLLKTHQLEQALMSYAQVLLLNPQHIGALNNQGYLLQELGNHEQALNSYNQILSIDPKNMDALIDRGTVFMALKQFEKALHDYHTVVTQYPDFAPVHWHLGWCYLLLGELDRGWEEFEWRFIILESSLPPNTITQPLWSGEQLLINKKILLWSEQGGFGDTIQFIRYVKNVAALGAQVYVLTHTPLKPLLENIHGVTRVIIHGEPLPHCDYQCPIISLPHRFKTNLNSIPADIPYLYSDPYKALLWKEKLNSLIQNYFRPFSVSVRNWECFQTQPL